MHSFKYISLRHFYIELYGQSINYVKSKFELSLVVIYYIGYCSLEMHRSFKARILTNLVRFTSTLFLKQVLI